MARSYCSGKGRSATQVVDWSSGMKMLKIRVDNWGHRGHTVAVIEPGRPGERVL